MAASTEALRVSARDAGVALVAAVDRVHGLEHGDVDDGHRPAGAGRPELLAEDAVLAAGDGRVVEPAGVDRDLVPVTEPAQRVVRLRVSPAGSLSRRSLVARPPHVAGLAARGSLRPGGDGHAEDE